MTGITAGENNRGCAYFWKKKVSRVLDVSICALMVHQPCFEARRDFVSKGGKLIRR